MKSTARKYAVVVIAAAAVTVMGGPVASAERGPGGYYGAIAATTDMQGGSGWGAAWNYPSADAAERDAMSECNDRRCELTVSWSNGCGSVAESQGKVWHRGGVGATREEAEQNALNKLRELTNQPSSGSVAGTHDDGHILVTKCTN
ncbi:DUF4189 domain-containing protein [Nocardia sp. NPDC052001]|uniref:DUF4189 domain-containing protein n=1 Tax=unclassified Nocardia TaxID=2637762 RepID=UPI0034246148